MAYTDELALELVAAGPVYRSGGLELGPDEVIAVEGLGTFRGVNIREKVSDALSRGKDLSKVAAKVHWESTRRGHASLTTSAILFWEVSNCSRLVSMLLVSPVFGSYLQESQRRMPLSRERLLIPAEVRGSRLKGVYSDAMDASFHAYEELRASGVPIEDARYVLPLSSATSLFASLPLESHLYLIRKAERGAGIVPRELQVLTERLIEMARRVAPLLIDARLGFRAEWGYYAASDPLRHADGLIQRLCGDRPEAELELLSVDYPDGLAGVAPDRSALEQASPLFRAMTVESLSLAAYHQAVRHRTVPTVPESIVEVAERWVRDPDNNIVVPPSVKSSRDRLEAFRGGLAALREAYRDISSEGQIAAALYTLPNSLKIRIVRVYNLFNLLSPIGFLSTRTCSAAQWEERAVAYRLWREVEKKVPWLADLMGEKCKHLGYCPEKEWCPIILKYHGYSDELHSRLNNPEARGMREP